MALAVIVLAVVWVILAAWIVAMILAVGLPAEPAPAPDPYAQDLAKFRKELHDWDRDGRP